MRILASNPDTLGDFVLRQPLYAALSKAGHELLLIVRKSVRPLAPLVAPDARVIELPAEVYGDVDARWAEFSDLVAEARSFVPDVLLVTPYHWTRFDERLAEALGDLPGFRTAALSGGLSAGDPFAGEQPTSTLRPDLQASVGEDLHEAEKNAALARLFDVDVQSVEPRLTPDARALETARQILAERGLEPGQVALACVSGTANVPIKTWPADAWSQVLRTWHERFGRRFLFVGLASERPVAEQVLAGMGEAASSSAIWMEPDASLPTLVALATLSSGYVGHDTGPMHIAAAVAKPVLALFGGGHGLRFTPCVAPSVTLTMRLACAGCGWACSFDQAHCVKAVRRDAVLQAAEDLETGRVRHAEHRLLEPTPELLQHMVGFSADLARDRLRQSASMQKRIASLQPEAVDALTSERDNLRLRDASLQRQLAEQVAAVESGRLEGERLASESAGLLRQLKEREDAVQSLRLAVEAADERTRVEADARQVEVSALQLERDALQRQVADLKQQVVSLTPLPPQPAAPAARRKTWRERLIDWICGTRHYEPRHVPPPMPMIRLVTRLGDGAGEADARETIDSVLAERYPHLDYVIAAEPTRHPWLQDYVGRVSVCPPGERAFSAVADAFAKPDADVVAWLDVGQTYEPGALMRIGEFFRDHSLAMAAVFEQTRRCGGFRVPAGWPAVGVKALQIQANEAAHVVFRRQAYALLGPLVPEKDEAAGWDLRIRFARRFGIRRAAGHAVCVNPAATVGRDSRESDPIPSDRRQFDTPAFLAARDAFEKSFGPAGRLRVAVTETLARMLPRSEPWPDLEPVGDCLCGSDGVAAFVEAPAVPGATLFNPVNSRRPDRLLFSRPDVTTGEPSVFRIYYDSQADTALAAPGVDGPTLGRLRHERERQAHSDSTPAPAQSPCEKFRGGPAWARWIARLPSPYRILLRPRDRDQTPAGRLRMLLGDGRRTQPGCRVLVVGSFDGKILDDLRSRTDWTLTGLETSPEASDRARARGHRIVSCSAQDAFMTLPDGEVFDVIAIPWMLETWDDPAWVLRRLLRLLAPDGRLVVRTPNLDSMLRRQFGPTWWPWQPPYHRVLFGRRGIRALAGAADLEVERLWTVTDAYPAALSVRLNALGLAGRLPEGTRLPDKVASEGARWAGWGRLLWDRCGSGDELWAVLRPV